MLKKRVLRNGVLILMCVVLAATASAAWLQAPSARADGKMRVANPTTESNFRKNFIFRIEASSQDSKIKSASLVVRERGSKDGMRMRLPKFEPAAALVLEYVWETDDISTPPWQVYFYRWELVDEAGERFESDEYEMEMVDTTRDWRKLEGKGVTVYWYEQDDEFGELILRAAETGVDYVSKATNFTPTENLRVIIYNTQEEFCSYWAALACKDWYGGVTEGTITVQWFRPQNMEYLLYSMIPHEIAHAFLNMRIGSRTFAVPRWFNEGQAMNAEVASKSYELQRVREMAQIGQLERLALLDAQTTITYDQLERVGDWYAVATSLVYFLYERFGTEVLGKIIDGMAEDKTFEEAFEAATGWTLDEYELEWRKWLGVTVPLPTLAPTETLPAFRPSPTFAPTRTPKP